jgi:hypothetical protein
MTELVFFLEEPSAREMLDGLLPRLGLEDIVPRYIVFEGKQDLEQKSERRLRGYRAPNALFVVVRDQDAQPDCTIIKRRLKECCRRAGRETTLIRIAYKELESFYLADLNAVEQGLGIAGIAKKQNSSRYRAPDQVVSPKRELIGLTKGEYQPIAGSRAIAPCLDPANGRSPSFRNLVAGIRRLVQTATSGEDDP